MPTKASQECTGTLCFYHLRKGPNHAPVVDLGVQLDTCLDAGEGMSAKARSHWGCPYTYTSTGVRAPWVTEQQTAPASANLEYSAIPESFSGVLALAVWTTASSFVEPVDDDGAAITKALGSERGEGFGNARNQGCLFSKERNEGVASGSDKIFFDASGFGARRNHDKISGPQLAFRKSTHSCSWKSLFLFGH